MKVLMINGSSNEHGCTFTALSEVEKPLHEQGIETEIIQLGKQAYRDCIGCRACHKLNNRCVLTMISSIKLSKRPNIPTVLFLDRPFISLTPADGCYPF